MAALPAFMPILLGGLVAAVVVGGSIGVAMIAVLRSRKAPGPPPKL